MGADRKVSGVELWKAEPQHLQVRNPGCLQFSTKPIQQFLVEEGGVTSLQQGPEVGDSGAQSQLLYEGPGRRELLLPP